MTGHDPLPISRADLLVVANDLWDASFECALTEIASPPAGGDGCWAEVDLLIGGRPAVRVVVEADRRTLRDGARMTFPTDEPDADELEQVMAEGANMVAGNVKGILRLGTELSLPRAGHGRSQLSGTDRSVTLHAGDEQGRRLSVYVVDLRLAGCR